MSLLSAFRNNLEPAIFDELREKYGAELKEYWDSAVFPKEAKNTVLLVERRVHPNIEFVLHNFMYFCRGFSLTVVCSDENLDYVKGIVGNHTATIMPIFKGEGDKETGIREYNELMTDAEFYKKIPAEYILSMQTDSYLRKPLPEMLWEYEYIACPWAWKKHFVGGGGLTFRNRECVIDICEKSTRSKKHEDVFFSESCFIMGKKVLPIELRETIFSESCFTDDPVGVHQWWTYLPEAIKSNDNAFFDKYYKIYMDLFTREYCCDPPRNSL